MSFAQIGNDYDKNIRKVIPYYDEIHAQTIDLLTEFAQGREIALLEFLSANRILCSQI